MFHWLTVLLCEIYTSMVVTIWHTIVYSYILTLFNVHKQYPPLLSVCPSPPQELAYLDILTLVPSTFSPHSQLATPFLMADLSPLPAILGSLKVNQGQMSRIKVHWLCSSWGGGGGGGSWCWSMNHDDMLCL